MSSLRFMVSPDATAEQILSCFSASFGVGLKPLATREEHYLDSFDWRLYEAGLLLCVTKSSRRKLSLMDRDSREVVLSAPLRGRGLPRFATEFGDAALSEKLEEVLTVRAADPVVSVTVNRQPFALLDQLEKTVVRGALEFFTREGATRPFLALMTLSAVRGYDKALDKARELAQSDATITQTEQDFLALALEAGGRKPGDYTSKLKLSLDPQMSEAEAAATIFTTLADTIERNIEGTIANTDSEFLHDLRVAVRRTRSALSLLKPAIPGGALSHFRTEFSWAGRVTGPVRDLDVYLLAIDDYNAALPAHMQGALEPFRSHLTRRHRRESTKLAKALHSDRFKTLMSEWRDFISRPQHWASLGAADAHAPIKTLADLRIWKTYRTMEREGLALDEHSPAEAFHTLRKRGKKMRYALEFFRSLYPDDTIKPLIKDLKGVQQVLGDYQDFEVQARTVESFAADMAKDGKVPAETLLAMGTLVGDLIRRQDAARGRFAEAFESFAGKGSHKTYKALFKPVNPAPGPDPQSEPQCEPGPQAETPEEPARASIVITVEE